MRVKQNLIIFFNPEVSNVAITCFFQSVVSVANETAKKVRFIALLGDYTFVNYNVGLWTDCM